MHMFIRVRLEGQREVTRQDLQSICQQMEQRLMDRISNLRSEDRDISDVSSNERNDESLHCANGAQWKHLWGGRFHPVPEGFVLDRKDVGGRSTMKVKDLWELWFFGHAAHDIPPYRFLKHYDLYLKSDREYLSKCAKVMSYILK